MAIYREKLVLSALSLISYNFKVLIIIIIDLMRNNNIEERLRG